MVNRHLPNIIWAPSQPNNDKNFPPQTFDRIHKIRPTQVEAKTQIASVDLANQTLSTKTHLGLVKDMGPGLYGWEDTGEFTAWMELNPEETSTHTQVYTISATGDTSLGYPGVTLLADDLSIKSIYALDIDGTQPMMLEDLLLKEDILLSLHFRNTSTGTHVSHDFASYPSVPNDWYKPTKPNVVCLCIRD